MPSRADGLSAPVATSGASSTQVLRVVGAALHGIGVVCMLLLAWRLFTPVQDQPLSAAVSTSGTLDQSVATLLRSRRDTIEVTLDAVPDARSRAFFRAVRGSGHVLRVTAPRVLPALAVAAEEEWRASGGTRLQVVAADSARHAAQDAAGLIDSIAIDSAGLRTRSGPLAGALHVGRAGVAPLVATSPTEARVLVLGSATWESRFLVAALEEAGWPVDVAVSLSPKVTIGQGAARLPSRDRHAIVVLLPGAPSSAMAALPAFVRSGGGVVIVGEAARSAGVAAIRAGAPGATMRGEVGAEAGDEPRHGLDLVPVATLAPGSVALESRDGRVAVAARRVGAGRVMQVGYDNSWLWRMAGDDQSPDAHRRWWSALLSGIVSQREPESRIVTTAESDTLDAAPVAALARDLGLPTVGGGAVRSMASPSLAASLDPRWLLATALLSLVVSWTLRRWRGLA
ncbi:MAG: hypothetical protein V4813_09485 [Gemmatimonadota bacterium]